VILLCGIPTEPPLAMVAAELARLSTPHLIFNQRRFDETKLALELAASGARGLLRIGAEEHRLEDIAGAYVRLMDDRILPELRGEPLESRRRAACRALHDRLSTWAEVSTARIVNRARAMASNTSKPYQSQLLLAAGFEVPETLVTNDPALVREFLASHGRLVYKSTSGRRSIVRMLGPDDLQRLDDIRWCPVQFQAYVAGHDVRVHVIGSRLFGTRVISQASDYRYSHQLGLGPARLEALELEDELAERCVGVTRSLGLAFSGIDLRLTPDGRAVCFEVNPCPAFPYYERSANQPIAEAVARYLVGAAA
jgi:glutathione synthase/RimK-type ligase-like ATP-grasp enzyme